jgi:hypothetical protein
MIIASFKKKIGKLLLFLSNQVGINLILFFTFIYRIPFYLLDLYRFRKVSGDKVSLTPCLHDKYTDAGITKSEYFWQDLLVARLIYQIQPKRHVDVGSRIDGFVAHVASFMSVEVLDIRPVSTIIPGVVFKQADLMDSHSISELALGREGYCDSLSCLHAIEHFGLGRYGDPIDSKGYRLGISNLATLLKINGNLYLSTPIGQQRVEFNANWVFDPRTIIAIAKENDLLLEKLIVIGSKTTPREVQPSDEMLIELADSDYNLGLFVFFKQHIE